MATTQLAKVHSNDGFLFTVVYHDNFGKSLYYVYREGYDTVGNKHKILCDKFFNYGRAIDYIADRVAR